MLNLYYYYSLGTGRSVHTLTDDEEAMVNDLLRSLASYYQYRGINLKTSCEDFDCHHIGVIQESQVSTLMYFNLLWVWGRKCERREGILI